MTSSGGQAGATRDRSRFASGCRIRSRRCEYSWAFMSVDYTPATILCLPWKGWTVNSARPTWPVDPLTADQRDQWRTKGAVTTQETRLFISLPLNEKSKKISCSSSSSSNDFEISRLFYVFKKSFLRINNRSRSKSTNRLIFFFFN